MMGFLGWREGGALRGQARRPLAAGGCFKSFMNHEKLPPIGSGWRPWLLAWFGCGFARRAPGTVGSLGALPVAWLIQSLSDHPAALALASFGLLLFGWWAAAQHLLEHPASENDPQWIVIDEVAGVWLAVSLIDPSWLSYAVGFALFRLLDIWKPWPISWVDRNVKGGLGVMLDDYLAGFFAALLLYAAALVWWI